MHKTFTWSKVWWVQWGSYSPFAKPPSPELITHPSLSCFWLGGQPLGIASNPCLVALVEMHWQKTGWKGLGIYSSPFPALSRFWWKGSCSPPQMQFRLTALFSEPLLFLDSEMLFFHHSPRGLGVRMAPDCIHLSNAHRPLVGSLFPADTPINSPIVKFAFIKIT